MSSNKYRVIMSVSGLDLADLIAPKGETDLDLVKALHAAGHLPGWAKTSLDLVDVVFSGETPEGSPILAIIDPHTNEEVVQCIEVDS